MYPIPTKCPVCGDDLLIERLACSHCGTSIEGVFIPPRLSRLSQEQWHFIELFVRCEGRLNRIQEELSLSYPTVRNRLHDVIRAMGYEVGDTESDQRAAQSILDDLAEGRTTVEEALRLIGR